ncbi:hypothetical protein QNH46_19785 [Paenibacillus woosongensis]|uniref:DUF2768 domain-containing protein n=1 Tax=Paenibacillus woosongensis TaxID=307580 RepID=A0A7X3CPF4_9BACL|nr:hypothetical protein [Paenibacillus woosongensis]MUG47305.1 hypothetical protein [Paenibacillus woosongensis]WHX48318.1 hypothetical protein QNH46_19785 [Paenibacillus woosongensis]GIP59977.1 hypothetical protein J15TS10_37910 [Paenibacillus woosongensis]
METDFTASLFGVLYWVAMIAMSLVLIAITVAVFAIGIKFIKSSRKLLGGGSILFSLIAAAMIIVMVKRQFF